MSASGIKPPDQNGIGISPYEILFSRNDENNIYQKEILIGEKKMKLKDIEDFPTLQSLGYLESTDYSNVFDAPTSRALNWSETMRRIFDYEQVGNSGPSLQLWKKFRNNRPRTYSDQMERPFQCLDCTSAFASRGNLKFHVKTVHEKRNAFECPECDAVFSQKGNLKTHYNAVHLQIRPFECSICDAVFSQKGNLKTHLNKVHYADPQAELLLNSSILSPKKRGRPPTISKSSPLLLNLYNNSS